MGPGVPGGPQKLCPLLGRPGPCPPAPPPGCPRAAGGCREPLWGVRGQTLPCWGQSQGEHPRKEEPTARQGAAGLGDAAGPRVGVPPGSGSHQASHQPVLSARPNCWCGTPQPPPARLQQLSEGAEAKTSSWARFRGNQAIPGGQSMISCSLLPHAQGIHKKAEADYVN